MARSKKSFMDFFKINDSEDEFDDDLFDEDEYEEEEEDYDYQPVKKKMAVGGTSGNSYKKEYSASPAQSQAPAPKRQRVNSNPAPSRNTQNSKLVPINNRSVNSAQEVFVIKPDEFDEAQTVIDHLNDGKAIVINMEGIELTIAQRIIDFIGGACYSMDGSLQAISGNIFIAAPSDVFVTGDLREEILSESAITPQLGRY